MRFSSCLVLGAVLSSRAFLRAAAHPLCYFDARPTDPDEVLVFCPDQEDGACCNDVEEDEVISLYSAAGTLSTECADYYKQVTCGVCHSFSGHLYERLGPELGPTDGMTMKKDFCDGFVEACAGQIAFPTYDGEDYCTKHQGGGDDYFWSYPYTDPEIFDSGLTEVFSDYPSNPIVMHMSPDGSVWWIAGQSGQIIEIAEGSSGPGSTVVSLSGNSAFYVSLEEGLLDFAFSPVFDSNGRFYVSYTSIDDGGSTHNRLSMLVDSGGSSATLASEEILIETSAKSSNIHSGGFLGFKPSAYGSGGSSHQLFWAVGDSGPSLDTDNHGQNINDLHGTIVRISVPASGSGYTIPGGNLDVGLPEICSYGLRNPYRCGFDRETDELYCGNVGQTRIESVYIIECGKNYGWAQFEGTRCHEAAEDRFVPCDGVSRSGIEFPIYEYCHRDYDSSTASEAEFTGGIDICGDRAVLGFAIIGGYVYRGEYYSEVLSGAYIFADYQTGNVHYIKQEGGEWVAGDIVSDNSLQAVSFAEDNNGELYVVTADDKIYALPCGDLCSG